MEQYSLWAAEKIVFSAFPTLANAGYVGSVTCLGNISSGLDDLLRLPEPSAFLRKLTTRLDTSSTLSRRLEPFDRIN
jgi:hypothetical protein